MDAFQVSFAPSPSIAINDREDELARFSNSCHRCDLTRRVGQLASGGIEALHSDCYESLVPSLRYREVCRSTHPVGTDEPGARHKLERHRVDNCLHLILQVASLLD